MFLYILFLKLIYIFFANIKKINIDNHINVIMTWSFILLIAN